MPHPLDAERPAAPQGRAATPLPGPRPAVTPADMRDADRAPDGPEDAVVQHLANEQVLACVKQLGAEQQECIVLRFVHGLSVSETAEIMGKKDGAVKALQHRAVRRLA